MKNMLSLVALAVALSAVPATAEEGTVPSETLAAMGLGDLAPLSDAQGEEVKGKFAFAYSVSGTAVPGAFNISGAGATGNNFAIATSGSQSSAQFSAFGFGFFGPSPFGFGGFGVFANYKVQSSGYAVAFGF